MSLICRCFDVEKAAIIASIESGCRTVDAVKDQLGVTGNCAACRPDIEDLLAFYMQYPKKSDE
jgi:NAD(P)H-nitrite reductase large subunit